MIQKIGGFKNKYKLTESSNTRDIIDLCTSYEKFRCIICNEKTAMRFKPKSYVTINKNVEDDVFYVNGIFGGIDDAQEDAIQLVCDIFDNWEGA